MRRWAALAAIPFLLAGCLAVGPSGPYRGGQVVDLSITQFPAGARVWLSECAPAQVPRAATGCRPSLSGQPSVRLDNRGGGSAHFRVASVVNGIGCAGYCTIVATDGHRIQTVPISFVAKGSVEIIDANGQVDDIYINKRFFYRTNPGHGTPALLTTPGIYQIAVYRDSDLPGGAPIGGTIVTVEAGKGIGFVIFPRGNGFAVLTSDVPPPPAPGQVRVRFVNEAPVTVTPTLGSTVGTPIGPDRGTTLTLTGPPNVADGNDRWGASYPQNPPSSSRCTYGGTAGLLRGTGYLLTLVPPPNPVAGACPYQLFPLVEQRVG